MSVRLFPKTKNARVLAKLVDVSERAWMRMESYDAARAAFDRETKELAFGVRDEMGEAWWNMIRYDGSAYCAYIFKTQGWGRLNESARALIKMYELDPDIGGNTNDPLFIGALLNIMHIYMPDDIRIDDLEGLEWG
jgi:hypothetical protein